MTNSSPDPKFVKTSSIVGKALPIGRLLRPTVAALALSSSAFAAPEPDPATAKQSWFEKLNVGRSWEYATGRGVTIAACAPGFYEEEEIRENLLLNQRYDLSDYDQPYEISDGKFSFQGTAAASIMVGALDGKKTNGIAFNAKLVPLQNFNYRRELDDRGKEPATAACVRRAASYGNVDIILVLNQTRQGSSETYGGTRRAILDAVAQGITVVSSAGDYSRALKIEGRINTGSIIVGALREDLSSANFSNYGPRVNVSAIGERVYAVTGPSGKMRYFAGTSAAAAQVAAAVALVKEVNPRLTPFAISQLIAQTRKIDPFNQKTGGMLDVEALVLAARATTMLPGYPGGPHYSGPAYPGYGYGLGPRPWTRN